MKIDKIIFASSEEYSPFWNIQSRIWSTVFGIQPVLLLWGKVKNTDVSDTYGEVIEKNYSTNSLKSLQMTWSKFVHVATEPNVTWMTGDIDMFPLQTNYFVDNIKTIPDDFYSHLGYSLMAPYEEQDRWIKKGGLCTDRGGCDLVAYYHVAKGKTFDLVYDLGNGSLDDQVNRIMNTKKYGWARANKLSHEEVCQKIGHVPLPKEELPYWCSDENYTSDLLFDAKEKGKVNFEGRTYELYWFATRIDRPHWDRNLHSYRCDYSKLSRKEYIDFHAYPPPIVSFKEQEKSIRAILTVAGML